MKKHLLVASISVLLFSTFTHAQDRQPSDSALLALVNRHVQTPVSRTTNSAGDVFLQRDMTGYLKSTVLRPQPIPPGQADHGHDHKDAMLIEFLNRPQPSVNTLNKYFNQAALEFGVPVELLKATAQVQSNWAQVSESIYGSWGIMGLIENYRVHQINAAASLLQVTEDAIKNDAKTNIRAAAALLKYYQGNNPPNTLADWFGAMKKLNGLWDEALSNSLALRIYDVVREGSKTVSLWGEIINISPAGVSLPRSATEANFDSPTASRFEAVDYPNAVPNFTTCNFNSRPMGSTIQFYFVHYVATGTYQGAVNWFKDCSSSVSAHYVVRNSDGEVSQVVAEADRAWSQGVTVYNDKGIGVEHEVLATNLSMWDSDPMLIAAANLCVNVCNRNGIPKTRRITNGDPGIYGHSDVRATDCPNMTPARWTNYLNRLNTVNVAAPVLFSVLNPGTGTQITASWRTNIEPTLAGYRLYYATTDALNQWKLAADETTLTAATTSVSIDATQFIVPPAGNVYHFKLTAVATDGTNPLVESNASDIYSRSSNTTGPKVLIVDGFDRSGGTASYPSPTHSFATSYFKSLRNNAALQVSTAADEKIADGTILLTDYDIVVWFSGDESGTPIVLSVAEKTALKTFLDSGKKLFISGSEIAYNVGRTGGAALDLAFMNNYLKSGYVGDGSSTYTPATGTVGSFLDGVRVPFGFVYHEDFPDAITPLNGGASILTYNISPNIAGVAYKGLFGAGTVPGGVIYLSFPLETVIDTTMAAVMNKALAYFDIAVSTVPLAYDDAATAISRVAKRINVLANDFSNGSPLNPATVTIVTNPANGTVTVDNTGAITYISDAGYSGNDSYQYTVQNSNGLSNVATVTLKVEGLITCNPAAPETDELAPKRDMRGAWVSTVFNLDWPSSRSLTTAQQQAELITILDSLAKTNINTVFFQVRPEGDALFASTIDPWSYWLTGTQGTAPNPFWDPLAFAIEAAHARGMELHAWLNPYRAKSSTPTLAANHVATLHPDWTFVAGTATLLNPGLPDVRTYLTQVIGDIATRYDVDGIHFDDYFYPSGMASQDAATFTTYNPTGIATLADWRRNNVNLLIARVYDTLSLINTTMNRNIIFGVSPSGIWKSATPVGITGSSSFNDLYCDPIAWMQAGKVDYISPQLYWIVGGPQDYNTLSKWWNDQALANNRYLYPGLAIYRLTDASNWALFQIENQINVNRDPAHEQVRGQILFRTKMLMDNAKGLKTSLQNNQFKYKSLPPAMLWKDAICPNAPINLRRDGDTLRWDAPAAAADGDLPRKYAVYRFLNAVEALTGLQDAAKLYMVTYTNKAALPPLVTGYFVVTSIDKNNNESEVGMNIALSLTGLELTVRLNGNTSMIDWSTLTETNVRDFAVERSTDGRNFTQIATVTAVGNSQSKSNYNTQDFLQQEGQYFYRIRSNDLDGRRNYSAVRSVIYKLGDRIVIGPNPFTTEVNLSNLRDVKRVDLIDMLGRTHRTEILKNQTTTRIDGAGLPAGIYQLRLTKADGTSTVTKLVKL